MIDHHQKTTKKGRAMIIPINKILYEVRTAEGMAELIAHIAKSDSTLLVSELLPALQDYKGRHDKIVNASFQAFKPTGKSYLTADLSEDSGIDIKAQPTYNKLDLSDSPAHEFIQHNTGDKCSDPFIFVEDECGMDNIDPEHLFEQKYDAAQHLLDGLYMYISDITFDDSKIRACSKELATLKERKKNKVKIKRDLKILANPENYD